MIQKEKNSQINNIFLMRSSRYNVIFRFFCNIKNEFYKSNFYYNFYYTNKILLSRPIATGPSVYYYQINFSSTVYKWYKNKRY